MGTRRFRSLSAWLLDRTIVALALIATAGTALGLMRPSLDTHWLWVSGAGLPSAGVRILIAAFGLSALIGQRLHRRGRSLARALAAGLAVLCLSDAIVFFNLAYRGSIETRLPLPLSLLVGLLLLAWATTASRHLAGTPRHNRRAVWHYVVNGTFPLLVCGLGVGMHLLSFGATDYRRPADAAVVLGCAVRADGNPSGALRDRTHTAIKLYVDGWVKTLVFSGGRDPAAPLSEPACMRDIALAAGVPDAAIVLDETGNTTADTVAAAATLSKRRGWQSLIFVSHDYHLARIKLAAVRSGLRAYTVPARETAAWGTKPLFIAREVVAFAWYAARPALQ